MKEPVTIEHDPNEGKPDRSWLIAWAVVTLIFGTNLYFQPIDWLSLVMGFGAGAFFACWAIDITGNKIPDSWRR